MIEEELQPKTELERAFVQARSWKQMHTWRRGTTDLRSGRIGSAVGIYLALVRSQALAGQIGAYEATLNSLNEYKEKLTVPDKLSAVRVLCSIMNDVKNETEESLSQQLIQKCLTQSAVAFTAQIKDDKLAVIDAVALIKKSSEFDVINEHLHKKQVSELEKSIKAYQLLLETGSPLTEAELQRICDLSVQSGEQVQTPRLMVHLGLFLLDNKHIQHAIRVLECVLELIKTASPITDCEIADLCTSLGDKLFIKGCRDEACECLVEAIFARIRANDFSNRSVDDLAIIATQAVLTGQYTKSAETFESILRLLEFSKDVASPNKDLLLTHTQIHHHLVSILSQPELKLDLPSLATLKELIDKSSNFSGSSFFVNLLPNVATLMQSNADKEYNDLLIDLLWNSAYSMPVERIYDTYIIPLALMTEQLLGSSTPRAFTFYKRISHQIEKSNLDSSNLIKFWTIILKLRAETDGQSSPSLLPLLAALAQQYLATHQFEDCLDIIERVQLMNVSDSGSTNDGANAIPHYVHALLELTEVHMQLPNSESNPLVLLGQVELIYKSSEKNERIHREIRATMQHFGAARSLLYTRTALRQLPALLQKILRPIAE